MTMKKVINKIKSNEEEQKDIEYWQSRSAEERLLAVQILREQFIKLYHKEDEYNESRKRLRRFCRIIKLSNS